MNVNKVILIGRLGKDPIVSHPQPELTKAEFTLATTESYKKDNQWVDITEWHNITAWRSSGLYAEKHLKKGMLVYVEGKIRSNKWQDSNGNQRTTYEIVADNLQKLEKTPTDAQHDTKNTFTASKNTLEEPSPDAGLMNGPNESDIVPF
ncbi:MAG: single-stranded DNA-binding protein [Bacteroidales bacterium]|nr:single-stranded DNA-binding protein [Bacteroidales bacterium]HOY40037.1 single-stranded DNA-binding protein [Bacteroidales bacterium]HQP04917.1 single-stranded DNA-binding protein [Bacteroidales bacterium]